MSVYVHPLMACIPSGQFRWNRSTHMVADSAEELHAFAKRIGLRRAWFQDKKLPHYDLNPSRFNAAIKLGAVLVSRRDFVEQFIRPLRDRREAVRA